MGKFFQRKTNPARGQRSSGFLMRLLRDKAGNTMYIIAIAMVPVGGMVGAGLDMSRSYTVRSRMQAACDAGALAARKAAIVGDGTSNNRANVTVTAGQVFLDADAKAAGQTFFNNNLPADFYGAKDINFALTVDNVANNTTYNQVKGNVTAAVPRTLTNLLATGDTTLAVDCAAKLDLVNTDVMMVVDNTLSMNCTPDRTGGCQWELGTGNITTAGGVTGSYAKGTVGTNISKMAGLRQAVKDFYTDMTANAVAGTQLRFGFVPYSSGVNVGGIIMNASATPGAYIADSFAYQSKVAIMDRPVTDASGKITGYAFTNWRQTPVMVDASQYKLTLPSALGGTGNPAIPVADGSPSTTTLASGAPQEVYNLPGNVMITPEQHAAKTEYNLFEVAALPGYPAANLRVNKWDGCIQEADTRPDARFSYTDQASLPYDMQIDLIPSAGNPATQWRTERDALVWYTSDTITSLASGPKTYFYSPWISGSQNPDRSTTAWTSGYYSCPTAAKAMQSWPDSASISSYVNSLVAQGGTYHDIGMVWGGRLLSPDGILKAENSKLAPNGQPVAGRHLIFMTDGLMCTTPTDDAAWGLEKLDKRVLGQDTTKTTCSATDEFSQRHYSRFLAICEEIKAKNITIWTINFGVSSGNTIDPYMQKCATNDGSTTDVSHTFYAADTSKMRAAMKEIAARITKLRVTG